MRKHAPVDSLHTRRDADARPRTSHSYGELPNRLMTAFELHDRIIGALELCCRRGEMLMIQTKRVNWETCQIGIPGATTKDKENPRLPFNPKGRLAAILKRLRNSALTATCSAVPMAATSRTSRPPGKP